MEPIRGNCDVMPASVHQDDAGRKREKLLTLSVCAHLAQAGAQLAAIEALTGKGSSERAETAKEAAIRAQSALYKITHPDLSKERIVGMVTWRIADATAHCRR